MPFWFPADIPWSSPISTLNLGHTLNMFRCPCSALMRMASWRISTRRGFDTRSVTPGATPPLPSPSRTWQVGNGPLDNQVTSLDTFLLDQWRILRGAKKVLKRPHLSSPVLFRCVHVGCWWHSCRDLPHLYWDRLQTTQRCSKETDAARLRRRECLEEEPAGTRLYCTLLNSTQLYCTLLYSTALYWTLLNSTVTCSDLSALFLCFFDLAGLNVLYVLSL